MNPRLLVMAVLALLLGLLAGGARAEPPLTLLQTIEMPDVPAGPYADHMALDVKGQRLFTTPQAQKAVADIDLRAGSVVHTIRGFVNPHAILYREDRNRLFVTDGRGALVILDAGSYREPHSGLRFAMIFSCEPALKTDRNPGFVLQP
jgi:hypothetical protein